MSQIRTLSCKLEATPEQAKQIDATLQAFADACNFVSRQTPPTLSNAMALQALVYQQVREKFGLSANLAIRAIARVAGPRKAKQPGKEFAPTSADYDARIFSFRERDWTVSLTLVSGRERFPLVIGNYQQQRLIGQQPTSATLVKRQNGAYFLHIQVKTGSPEPRETEGVLGVDLGRRDIAMTSEGEGFSGAEVQTVRDRHAKHRQSLSQKAAKGTRSRRRRCRGLQRIGKGMRIRTEGGTALLGPKGRTIKSAEEFGSPRADSMEKCPATPKLFPAMTREADAKGTT